MYIYTAVKKHARYTTYIYAKEHLKNFSEWTDCVALYPSMKRGCYCV